LHHQGLCTKKGQPLWIIFEDMERIIFMLAKETKVYGIVDLVTIENAPNS
jgi:ATP-dependent protease ClpP protease subunit